MSETNAQRLGPVLQALNDFRDDPSVAKRTALFAALDASRARKFFLSQQRLFITNGPVERDLGGFRNQHVGEVITQRLNDDLVAGWNPDLTES